MDFTFCPEVLWWRALDTARAVHCSAFLITGLDDRAVKFPSRCWTTVMSCRMKLSTRVGQGELRVMARMRRPKAGKTNGAAEKNTDDRLS